MTDTKKLKEKIAKSGLKYKYIAQEIGITPTALNKKINNKSDFRGNEIISLCKILNVIETKEMNEIFFGKIFKDRVDEKSTSKTA